MSDEFKITEEKNYDDHALTVLAELVAKNLARPPFRKRHPLIFWVAVILLAVCAVKGIFSFLGDSDELGGERLALVRIGGVIMEPTATLSWLRDIERNSDVKGVLLRVDSPGGGAAASQEIYAALDRVAQKKPIVASMGATAASGGLMVCMAAEKIYANASTITGSIGVRMDIPQLEGLMEKIGVGQETLVTAPYKDAASWSHPLSPKDREYLESVLFNMHDQFVDIVAKGRKMPREEAAKLASGKIFTGQEAVKLGLVDELGGRDDAQAWLAAKTGVSADKKLLTPPSKKLGLAEKLLNGVTGMEVAPLKEASERLLRPAFLYQWGNF